MSPDQNRGRLRALVTGGTGSLGFYTAQAILGDPRWEVVVTGRSEGALADTTARLGDRAYGRRLDLGSLDQVRRFADELPPVDAVICNAGLLAVSGTKFTTDGIEQTFGVNHLGHFLLVNRVLCRMRIPGRVVFVSSGTHDPARRTGFPPPRFTTARELAFPVDTGIESPMRVDQRRYTTSKLCGVLAAYEFARRVPPDVATFNVFDPGQMPGTGIGRDLGGIRAFAWRRVMPVLTLVPGLDVHTARRSATALARLVLDPRLAATTGRYVNVKGETRSSAESHETEKAADLWETSMALSSEAVSVAEG